MVYTQEGCQPGVVDVDRVKIRKIFIMVTPTLQDNIIDVSTPKLKVQAKICFLHPVCLNTES